MASAFFPSGPLPSLCSSSPLPVLGLQSHASLRCSPGTPRLPALPVGRFPLLHGVLAGEALQGLGCTGLIPLRLHKVCKKRAREEHVRACKGPAPRVWARTAERFPLASGSWKVNNGCLGADSETLCEFGDGLVMPAWLQREESWHV